MRRRRVLPWGALSHHELLNTARARAREPSNVLAEPGGGSALTSYEPNSSTGMAGCLPRVTLNGC